MWMCFSLAANFLSILGGDHVINVGSRWPFDSLEQVADGMVDRAQVLSAGCGSRQQYQLRPRAQARSLKVGP